VTTRILLAEDHAVLRQGLRSLLEREPGWEVVAEAADGPSAVRLAAETSPDVAILDIGLPGLNGIEVARGIAALGRNVRILALSVHSHRRFVLEMLRAGAAGYVLKECAYEEVVRGVRQVLRGQLYLCPKVSTDIVRDYLLSARDASPPAFSLLTGRERQVLQLVAEGQTTKEIAAGLGVSVKTVETFRHQIMRKLDLHSVAELTKYAVREGLTSLER
jgi:DNA-binding NarL/FixJ family response regulator